METTDNLHRARRRRQSRLSAIWLVPLAAALIGLWLLYDNLAGRGPGITLVMENAEGIEAGTTLIKALNVDVGLVEQVELSEDLSRAVITARMSPGSERMLVEDTRFWVVKPRIGREGISGLGTVLSGAYIQLQPGQGDEPRRLFEVMDVPPVTAAGAEGLHVRLVGQTASVLQVGDPVSYQGLTVGRVEEMNFDAGARRMLYRVFIESPYDTLVTQNTRFWSAGGIDLRLDAQGFRVSVESLEALLVGGITFDSLEGMPGASIAEDSLFTLFPDEEGARQDSFSRFLEYVLLIDASVHGLAAGAPVEYRGVRVGTVAMVPFNFSLAARDAAAGFSIPVLIRIEPERMAEQGGAPLASLEDWAARLETLFRQGLRASLKTGNLLTGSLYVDLDFTGEDEALQLTQSFNGVPVFPSTSGGFAQLEAQVAALLAKLNDLEIEPVLGRLEQNLAASETMLGEMRELAESMQNLVESPDTQALPENLNLALRDLRGTLQGFAPESAPYEDLARAIQGLESLLRELRPVARTLSEQPNALIFDRRQGEDPVPRAAGGNE